MSTSVIKAGYWSAIGGIYGSRRHLAAAKSDIKRAFRGFAKIQFVTDRLIGILDRVVAIPFLARRPSIVKIQHGVGALRYIHGLSKGVPSSLAENGVSWRIDRPEDVGFFWSSPTFAATAGDSRRAVDIAESLFGEYGYELPITMSFVTPDRLVGTMSCTFNKSDPEERERALGLYHRLREEFSRAGIRQYRSGVLGMPGVGYDDPGKRDTLARIKRALDPNGVSAPGRYGIG
jgi:4-cresol dehydrogenase (hydroxylating)